MRKKQKRVYWYGLVVTVLLFSLFSHGVKKKDRTKAFSKRNFGVRVLKTKKGSLFKKLELKENDVIVEVNDISIRNSRHFVKVFKKAGKKDFTITLFRDNQVHRLSYIVSHDPLTLQYSYKIKKTKAREKPKRKDLLKQHSHILQEAYVVQSGTLVYAKPNFDAEQIYLIPYGKKITISRKVLKAKSGFGSFYKVFIKKPQKIVGYISEVEVVPELVKKKNKYSSNPKYVLFKKNIKGKSGEAVVPPMEPFVSETVTGDVKPERFIGIVVGSSFEGERSFMDRFLFGLQFSGYNLLVSYINMDINLIFNPSWKNAYFDVIGRYVFLKADKFEGGVGIGLKTDIQFFPLQDVYFDFIVSLSGGISITKNLWWRNDLRLSGFFQQKAYGSRVSPYFLTALQWGF